MRQNIVDSVVWHCLHSEVWNRRYDRGWDRGTARDNLNQ